MGGWPADICLFLPRLLLVSAMEVFVSLWADAGCQEMVNPGAEHTVVPHCWNSVGEIRSYPARTGSCEVSGDWRCI